MSASIVALENQSALIWQFMKEVLNGPEQAEPVIKK